MVCLEEQLRHFELIARFDMHTLSRSKETLCSLLLLGSFVTNIPVASGLLNIPIFDARERISKVDRLVVVFFCRRLLVLLHGEMTAFLTIPNGSPLFFPVGIFVSLSMFAQLSFRCTAVSNTTNSFVRLVSECPRHLGPLQFCSSSCGRFWDFMTLQGSTRGESRAKIDGTLKPTSAFSSFLFGSLPSCSRFFPQANSDLLQYSSQQKRLIFCGKRVPAAYSNPFAITLLCAIPTPTFFALLDLPCRKFREQDCPKFLALHCAEVGPFPSKPQSCSQNFDVARLSLFEPRPHNWPANFVPLSCPSLEPLLLRCHLPALSYLISV